MSSSPTKNVEFSKCEGGCYCRVNIGSIFGWAKYFNNKFKYTDLSERFILLGMGRCEVVGVFEVQEKMQFSRVHAGSEWNVIPLL